MKISSKNFSLNSELGTCEITFTIPNAENTESSSNFFLTEKCLKAFKGLMLDCLGSRMSVCIAKLMTHFSKATYVGDYAISWQRKDESFDHFIPSSYKAMEDLKVRIERDPVTGIMEANSKQLDQLIKSLLNMPELSHADVDGCRFSTLVSILMERYAYSIMTEC